MNKVLILSLPLLVVSIIGLLFFFGPAAPSDERLEPIDDLAVEENEIPEVLEPIAPLQPEPPPNLVEPLDPEGDPMNGLVERLPPQEPEPPPENVEPPPIIEPIIEPDAPPMPEPIQPGPEPEPEPEPEPLDPDPVPLDEPPPEEPEVAVPPVEEQDPVLEGRVEIIIRNFEFTSNNITIRRGTEVVWIMEDNMGAGFFHTVTSDDGQSSRQLFFGDSLSITFTESGEFRYHCNPHPWMTGTIIIVD